MRTTKFLTRLPFIASTVAVVIFSAQVIITNNIKPAKTTALSIASITPNQGPTTGGELITVTGSLNLAITTPQIATGFIHSLGIDNNNQLWTWGSNNSSQLGNGTSVFLSATPTPVDMSGVLTGRVITQISTQGNHNLVLDSKGHVFAWGANAAGQLGDGTNTSSNTPVAVDTSGVLAGRVITQISAGSSHSIALDDEGRIFTWGLNSSGQLGDGTTTGSSTPIAVDMSGVLDGKNITQITAGGSFSLALDDEGTVFAWGSNGSGQLGNGTTTNSSVPVAVDVSGVLAGRVITQITAGLTHTLALDSNGQVLSWGNNESGRLGNGTTTNSSVPVAVDVSGVLAGRVITQITAGTNQSVVLDTTGRAFSWGNNERAHLGNHSTTNSSVPVAVGTSGVLADRTITQIATGSLRSLALDDEGRVFAWGAGMSGELGNGSINIIGTSPVSSFDLLVSLNTIMSVTIGGLPCTDVTIVDSDTITCTTPAHPAGKADVTINTSDGSSVTLHQAYTYISTLEAPNTETPDIPNTGYFRYNN
ncbi:IPT/TIG domain-containing protein [Candidatus Saccharibacteria bacterium]|nr:IPT/TIG domain-containing protein [Candidatus Saccharibacteria bacterium]